MSDPTMTPGVSSIINPPVAPATPLTREAAAARLADLKANHPEYIKRYLDGGVAEKAEMEMLHRAITNSASSVQGRDG